ncbi:hypothetical protein NKG05_29640 [Oerskovia sp. M15]
MSTSAPEGLLAVPGAISGPVPGALAPTVPPDRRLGLRRRDRPRPGPGRGPPHAGDGRRRAGRPAAAGRRW